MTETQEPTQPDESKDHAVVIVVNRRDVRMPQHEATGAEIKAKAEIPADFLLYHEKDGKLNAIADAETVKLRQGERFRAVSGQDVS